MDTYEITLWSEGQYYKIHLNEEEHWEYQMNSHNTAYLYGLIERQRSVSVEKSEGVLSDGASYSSQQSARAKLTGIFDGDTGEYLDLSVTDSLVETQPPATTCDTSSAVTVKFPAVRPNLSSPISSRPSIKRPALVQPVTRNVNQTNDGPTIDLTSPKIQVARSKVNNSSTVPTDNSLNAFFNDKGSNRKFLVSTARGSKGGKTVQESTIKRKMKPKLSTLFDGELLDEAEAFFLGLVFERPLLFDYKIPIAERNPISIATAWDDVRDEMQNFIRERLDDDSKITVEVLKDTWLNLRTGYMRYKSSSKKPSGSSPSKIPEIKHLDLLRSYDSVAEKRSTLSSFDDDEYDEEYANSRQDEFIPPNKRGRGRDNSEFIDVAKKVLHSVSNNLAQSSKLTNPPSPAVPSSSSSSRFFAESLIHDLDLLNTERRSSAKMRISQVIFDELTKQNH